jgi:hypothetical protein
MTTKHVLFYTQVERGCADLAVNEITVSVDRLSSFAISDFYFQDILVIVTRAPRTLVPLSSVARPFSAPVRHFTHMCTDGISRLQGVYMGVQLSMVDVSTTRNG